MQQPCINVQRLDKIKETPGNFKQIHFNMVFWLQPSHEIRLCAAPFLQFLRWSLNSAVIFVFLWSFLTIRGSVWQSLSDRFRFLPEFCFSEVVFPTFSNAVFTFETVLFAIPNNSTLFVTLAPTIRVLIIWPLLKYDRSAILVNFDCILMMISVKKQF